MDPYDLPWLPEEVKHPKKAKNTDAKSLPFKGKPMYAAEHPNRLSRIHIDGMVDFRKRCITGCFKIVLHSNTHWSEIGNVALPTERNSCRLL